MALTGDCVNPYYPIREGTTLTYQNTSMGEPELSYSMTFSDVSADGFTVTQSFENVTTEIHWICSEEGMISSQFMQLQMAQLGAVEFESSEFTGVTLPPADQWESGLTWTSGYSVTGKMSIEGVGAVNAQIEMRIDNEITAQEEVTAPVGTYPDAMRVDSNATVVIRSKVGDIALPPTEVTSSFANWYVRDVGMVRSASTDPEISYVTELLSLE